MSETREALVIELAKRAAESAVALGQLRIEINEAADGSGRYVAAIGWDADHFLFTPAPLTAPGWARARFTEWSQR
jgi:hypothetical protein